MASFAKVAGFSFYTLFFCKCNKIVLVLDTFSKEGIPWKRIEKGKRLRVSPSQ